MAHRPIQFALDEQQIEKYMEWRKTKHEKPTAIGGAFTFQFTPTSIGCCVHVVFLEGTAAEERLDLTDYDSW